MSIGSILVIIAAVFVAVVVPVALVVGRAELTRRELRGAFGPEYDLAVAQHGGRRAAVKELARRRVAQRALRPEPVSAADRDLYRTSWSHVQGAFLDDPAVALRSAELLVAKLLDARGYPADDEAEQIALLSVLHSGSLAAFRKARDTSRQSLRAPAAVSTEARRNALIQYHALFEGLLGEVGPAGMDSAVPGTRSATLREGTP